MILAGSTTSPTRFAFNRLNRFAAFLPALFLPVCLNAATWYASPSGSDSNPGTYSAPFRTVGRGIQAASSGDSIILQDGTYPADTPYGGGSTNGWLVWIAKSGAPGAPITLKAEHKQKAILDCGNVYGQPQTGCNGYIYLGNPGPAYWVFQDLVFTRTYDIALLLNSPTPGHDITVKGCKFEQIGQHVSSSTTGMDGVYANQGHYNITFDGNVFDNIGRIPAGSTYPNNDHALYLHSTNTTVINNVFYGPVSGWDVQTAAGFSGVIANNTFASSNPNASGQVMLWDSSGSITVQNNIFYNPPSGSAINTYALAATSCLIDHNLVYNGTIGGSGCPSSNTKSADPMLMSVAGLDFHLNAGSPAIDAGVSDAVATDADGSARPQGAGIDIGAYEYAAVVAPPVISGVTVSGLTTTSATISWNTDKAADSQSQYGPGSYTATSPLNTSMVTAHSVTLSNLASGATYHFDVLSRDSSGNLATSSDYTFTTSAQPPPVQFGFSLSASPSSVSVAQGQSATAGLTTVLLSGLAQSVTFSATGLPGGVSASFSPASCTVPCVATMTLLASTGTAAGTYGVNISASNGATASTPVTLTVTAPISISGLVSSWGFNEGSGSSTGDASGNGNTGRLNGATAWTTGSFGTALAFNGSNSYVSVPESTSLEVTKYATVAFWINAADVPGVDQRIVAKNYDWDIKLNGSNHLPQLSSGSKYAEMNYALPMGSWQHVVFTMSSGSVKAYINGVQVSLAANNFNNGFAFPTNKYGLNIGADSSGSSVAKGIIDDVQIYNRALSASEISSLYTQTRH